MQKPVFQNYIRLSQIIVYISLSKINKDAKLNENLSILTGMKKYLHQIGLFRGTKIFCSEFKMSKANNIF